MIQKFFDIKRANPQIKYRVPQSKTTVFNCSTCGLYKHCKSPKMEYGGEGREGILFLAMSPGKTEDDKGTQLVGESGQLLMEVLDELDFDLNLDGYKYNSVNCRTFTSYRDRYGRTRTKNRNPTVQEINCCRPRVFQTIKKLQPKKIIMLGGVALTSLLGHRTTDIGGVTKWIGCTIPDQEIGCWLFCTNHPSYLLYSNKRVVRNLFKKQLEDAINWSKPFVRYENDIGGVQILLGLEETCEYLQSIINTCPPRMAIDYETTGLKPYNRDRHRIICMSMATDGYSATAFPIFDDKRFLQLLKTILTNPRIKKDAQNLKFEEIWTREVFGYGIEGWDWDTMQAAHILDNRTGVTGLKHQVYKQYGTIGYDDYVSKYLKAVEDEGANSVNRLAEYFERNPRKVLLYNGLDSKFTFRLGDDQRLEIAERHLEEPMRLFMNGVLAFADIEQIGVKTDTPYYEQQSKHLERKIDKINKRIQTSKEGVKWIDLKRHPINPRSDKQLQHLFYKILDYTPTRWTEKNNISVDNEALRKIDTPFANDIIEYNRLDKAKGTYVDGFLKEIWGDLLHTFFNLHSVRSYRSSSSDPNFQNIYKRNEMLKKLIRKGMIPRSGHKFLEIDYNRLEVNIGTCYHKDPVMINYINDPQTDMHRDAAMDLFFLRKNQVTKKLRYGAKNSFVFREFYGGYYAQVAPDLWPYIVSEKLTDGTPLMDHVKKHGIKHFGHFEKHVKKVEDSLWNEKFTGYRDWKKSTWETYQDRLYIDLLTGFRCCGMIDKNQVVNYPIQGTAFHCLLWSLIKINEWLNVNKMNTKIVSQVHDSILFDLDPDEESEIIKNVRRISCEDIRRAWPWIIVPLSIDMSTSVINGNWNEMEEIQ